MELHRGFVLASALLLGSSNGILASDWPHFRGPDFTGISKEAAWRTAWIKDGLETTWRASVGLGFSTVSVADGRVVTTGHDGAKDGQDTIWCFDAATGRELWKHTYPAPLGDKFFEGGTTGTPTHHDGRVYHLSRQGDFLCLEAATGKIVWQRQVAKEDGFEVPEWGFACSPVVEGNLLLLNVGDAGTAFDKRTGQIVWTNGKGPSAYATVIPFDLNGKRCAAVFTHRHCVAVEVANGTVLWKQEFKSNYDTNSGAPLIHDGTLLLSAYNVPAVKLYLGTGQPVSDWKTDTRVHFNAGVVIDGHLYTFHGQAGKKEGELRCLDWRNGETKWKQEGLGVGSLIAANANRVLLLGEENQIRQFAAGHKLMVLSEAGELLVVAASPAGFDVHSRAQVLGGKCWATPVFADRRLYCRNVKGDLICIDLAILRK
jgi:outer membrane protein assembly factor BamB